MQLQYDGTFQGLLTTIFEVYEYKFKEVKVITLDSHRDLFVPLHEVNTDLAKAARVWKGLCNKLTVQAQKTFYQAFLSEQKEIATYLLQYAQYNLDDKASVERNFAHPVVSLITQTAKKVYREKHRMEAFVRFQLTKDGLYYAVCQPDFNVLPLITSHFKNRYADQRWLIYDAARKYGVYYDLHTVETVDITFDASTNNGKNIAFLLDEKEQYYQHLWQQYFSSANIEARKNLKLHLQHMPKRYWNFLPEKQVKVF